MKTSLRLAFVASLFVAQPFSVSADTQYHTVCYEHHRDGSFGSKTVRETLGTNEGQAILAGICSVYTGNSATCAQLVAALGVIVTEMYPKGGDILGTIQAEQDRQICNAWFVTNDFSASSDTDSSMTLRANGNGPRAELATYAAIKTGARVGKWLRYQVIIETINREGDDDSQCVPNDQLLWETHDATWGNTVDRLTTQLDDVCLRWCTGQHDPNWVAQCK